MNKAIQYIAMVFGFGWGIFITFEVLKQSQILGIMCGTGTMLIGIQLIIGLIVDLRVKEPLDRGEEE